MRRLLISGIFVVFCFLTVVILAQVPQLLNYQGSLTDDKGIPIITPTTVRFSLYQGGDAATPGSGTLVYQEDASVTPDDNGVFSHLIGSGTIIYGALDSTVFQTASQVFLEITVDPAGANETLLPRKQIVTVGYSFKSELADDADTVDGQDASAFAPVVHNHDPDYVNEGQANSVNSAMIVDGTIVDADINASANIAGSKIDPTGLDADLLDGKDSEAFVHTSGDDMTGTLNVNTTAQYALYGTSSSISDYASGVYGYASGTSGKVFGVHAISDSPDGYGVYAVATASSGVNFGLLAVSNSPNGTAVKGSNVATFGAAYGLHGRSDSNSGYGVYGEATANTGTTYGVYGKSNSPGGSGVYGSGPKHGVYGISTDTTGTNWGVMGEGVSPGAWGVHGLAPTYGVYGYASATSGTNYGVYGKSASDSGARGVFGYATATSGTTYGVHGLSDSSAGIGVFGVAPNTGVHGFATATSGTNYGVYAQSNSSAGIGVYGVAPNTGVHGFASANSGENNGVYGLSHSTDGRGVYGEATATSGTTYGVYGTTASSAEGSSGVYGEATASSGNTYGVYGVSLAGNFGRGVFGWAKSTSGNNYGVYGQTSSTGGCGVLGYSYYDSGLAGFFSGHVRITKNLHVMKDLTVDGNKTCVQPIDNGKKVRLSAMESPEIWFEDFGTAQLVNGQAVVKIDSIFAQAANTGITYFVFLTPKGNCQGLYISRQDKDAFEVRELGDGTSNISFDYRIVAKRRGYEEVRFEEFIEPELPLIVEPNLPIEKK